MAETELARAIRTRIRASGPIPFHDVMRDALAAYYARGPAIGTPEGDFSTSVKFEPFRDAIARLVTDARASVGEPFRVVELGAGTGELASRVGARTGISEYVTVEPSAALRAMQEAAGARAVASMDELDPAPGLVFGNEVLDALPARRVVGGASGELLEVVVDLKGDAFRERLAPLHDEGIEARLRAEGVWPARGQIFDVAPALESFVRGAARLVERGFLVFIDYGDTALELYAPTRLNGTLAAYHEQKEVQDVYDDLGERDLTADVDFSAVERAAREAGMEPLGLASQQDFLVALGVDPDEFVARAGGLGSAFRVFAARRGTSATLPGFTARTPSR